MAQYFRWPVVGGGGGSGTVTSVSVASANGFYGSVANPTTTPAISVKTSVTGLLKGNGTAVSAAVAGTDYQAPITTGTTAQYFRGDLSLATFPTNLSDFTNGPGYITGISGCNLYDLADVGATPPSSGCVLAWNGTSWDAAAAGGGSQTPWTSNINGATYYLHNFGGLYDDNIMGPYKALDATCRTLHEVCGNTVLNWSNGSKFVFGQAISSCFELAFCNMPNTICLTDGSTCFWTANMYMPVMTTVCRMQFGELYLNDINANNKITFDSGDSAATSSMGQGAIRYNYTNNRFEQSLCGAAWTCLGGGGGGGSSCGCNYWVQMSDGMSGFAAAEGFQFNYCNYELDILGQYCNTGNHPKLVIANFDCANFDLCLTDKCGMGLDFNLRAIINCNSMSCDRMFMVTCSCTTNPNKYVGFNPWREWQEFYSCDGMTSTHCTRVGYDINNCCAFGITKCGMGSWWLNCCGDNQIWKLGSCNDQIKFEDNIVSYLACCNLQWAFNKGCASGWNEWVTTGSGVGLVISSSDCCCLCPLVLAQGLCERVKLDTDGCFRTTTQVDVCGGLSVSGTLGFSGTFDTATNTQITIVCGIITGIV